MRCWRRSPAGLAALALVVAAGCANHPATLAGQLRAWESGASYSSNQQLLSTDLGEIATGLRTGPLVAVHTACDGLGVDAGTAYGELPTPDQALTDDLNDWYLDLTNAAQDCSTAPSLHSKATSRYEALVAKARRALTAANRRQSAILGS